MSGPAPLATSNPNRPVPLRRAVYIHVSDLTSSYNIDHTLLEEQLAKVKAIRQRKVDAVDERSGVPTELDTNLNQKRLQPPRGGFNLCVLVGQVEVVVDKLRVDGSRVRLAEVEVGDETGTVSLRARDEQIDVLKEISERSGAAVLRNCTLELFQGKHLRLAITKWGKMCAYPDQIASTPVPPSKMNYDRHFSLIDLSAVASEMVVYPFDSYNRSESDGPSMPAQGNQNQPFSSSNTGSSNVGGGRGGSRGDGGGRGQGRRGKQSTSNVMGGTASNPPMNAMMGGYPDQSQRLDYQGGLHGYGGYPEDSRHYAYRQRQMDPFGSTQMHLQHQYEMQHRQMHQMYHNRHPPPAGHPQDQVRAMHAAPPMPGQMQVPPPTEAFGRPYSGAQTDLNLIPPHGLNPFLSPVQGSPPTPTPQQHAPLYSSPQMDSPRMNPQAATFDPTTYGKVANK